MKYKELKERLNELDIDLCKYGKELDIDNLAVVYDDKQYDVYFLEDCEDLDPKERVTFYNTVLEYAETPINERGLEYNVVAFYKKCGKLGNLEERPFYYRRGQDGELLTASEETNNDKNQRWSLDQIEEYDLENCEKWERY